MDTSILDACSIGAFPKEVSIFRVRNNTSLTVDSYEKWGGSERWEWLDISPGTMAINGYLPFERAVSV
jgi:hypothetical protein